MANAKRIADELDSEKLPLGACDCAACKLVLVGEVLRLAEPRDALEWTELAREATERSRKLLRVSL